MYIIYMYFTFYFNNKADQDLFINPQTEKSYLIP